MFLNSSTTVPNRWRSAVTNRGCQIPRGWQGQSAGRLAASSPITVLCTASLGHVEMSLAPHYFEMLCLFPHVLASSTGMVSDGSSNREITRMQEVHSCLVMQPWDECMIFRREPCLILQGHLVVLYFNVKHMAVVWNWGQRFKAETQNPDGGCVLWWQIKNFSNPFKSFIVCCFQVALSLVALAELITGDLNTFE